MQWGCVQSLLVAPWGVVAAVVVVKPSPCPWPGRSFCFFSFYVFRLRSGLERWTGGEGGGVEGKDKYPEEKSLGGKKESGPTGTISSQRREELVLTIKKIKANT